MRKHISSLLLFSLSFAVGEARGQGAFQDLNFDSAQIPPNTRADSTVPVGQAFPGWSAYVGPEQLTSVGYNFGQPLDSSIISISTSGNNYYAYLAAGRIFLPGSSSPSPANASLTQTGIVPANAKSIQFEEAGSNFSVTLGGQNITVIPIGTVPNYTVYAGDISQFAGQSVALTIASLPVAGGYSPNLNSFDDIQFSPNPLPVPEPGTCALLLGGAVLLGLVRWKRRFESPTPAARS